MVSNNIMYVTSNWACAVTDAYIKIYVENDLELL